MKPYQKEFIEFAIGHSVLRFGQFTLKSGRCSPYFFNTGLVNTGAALGRLAEFYAAAIVGSGIAFDMLFGPAYKGIPLATAVALTLARDHARDLPVAYNRKEAKDHGEGGNILGAPLAGRVLIVDDVITAGTSVNEAVGLIRAAGATPAAVVIALDRQERGAQGERSAAQEVERLHGIPVLGIVGLTELLEYLQGSPEMASNWESVSAYRARYGTAA